MQQLHEFFTNVAPLDVVNVTLTDDTSDAPMTRRARLLERTDAGFLAELEGFETPQEVQRHQITRRVRLPWKPRDLRDYLIIFRRRNATKSEYVEDLRARRAFDEADTLDAFTEPQFVQWLTEGRYDCEVAQTLLHAWTRFMKGTANDALSDFYHDLLREAQQNGELEDSSEILPLSFLAHFIRERCVLPFHVAARGAEDVEAELAERILEEHRAIHAYVRTWQSSGAYPLDPSKPVQEALDCLLYTSDAADE